MTMENYPRIANRAVVAGVHVARLTDGTRVFLTDDIEGWGSLGVPLAGPVLDAASVRYVDNEGRERWAFDVSRFLQAVMLCADIYNDTGTEARTVGPVEQFVGHVVTSKIDSALGAS